MQKERFETTEYHCSKFGGLVRLKIRRSDFYVDELDTPIKSTSSLFECSGAQHCVVTPAYSPDSLGVPDWSKCEKFEIDQIPN